MSRAKNTVRMALRQKIGIIPNANGRSIQKIQKKLKNLETNVNAIETNVNAIETHVNAIRKWILKRQEDEELGWSPGTRGSSEMDRLEILAKEEEAALIGQEVGPIVKGGGRRSRRRSRKKRKRRRKR